MKKQILGFLICTSFIAGIALPGFSQDITNSAIPEYNLEISKTWQPADWFLYNPRGIAAIGNYIIIIDENEDGQIVIVNRQNQELVTTLGRQGKGPGEFIGPWEIIASRKGNEQFCIFDIQLRKISCFDLEKIITDKNIKPSLKVNLSSETGIPIRFNKLPGANKFIITGIFTDPYRFMIADSMGNIIKKSEPIDHQKGSEPINVFQHAYTVYPLSNLDGDKIAFGYKYTNIFEIYSTSGELLKRTHVGKEALDPVFGTRQTSQGPTMALGPDTQNGFTQLNAGRDNIFALYSGHNFYTLRSWQSNTILIYDWNGQHKATLKLEQYVRECTFTLDEEKLYCIDQTKMEPAIVEYDIPEID